MAEANVFVDTAGFLALWDASDEHHVRALGLQSELARQKRGLVTTDYVVDETVTLLLVRHSHAAASDFLGTINATQWLQLEWTDSERFHAAAAFFVRHEDKDYSFTDCVSFSVMRDLGIKDGFTTDHHFRQAGFNPLLHL